MLLSDLAVYHDATKGVVVLEYASGGHVVGTGRRYYNRYISVLTLRGGGVVRWRDYLTRSLYSMRLAGRHADVPPGVCATAPGSSSSSFLVAASASA